jgi:hypothetical protein
VNQQRRFAVAVVVTVVVVAYVVVPWVSDLIEGLARYTPTFYEPKDFARGGTARPRGVGDPGGWGPDALAKAGLCVLLVVVWVMATGRSRPGGRPR